MRIEPTGVARTILSGSVILTTVAPGCLDRRGPGVWRA